MRKKNIKIGLVRPRSSELISPFHLQATFIRVCIRVIKPIHIQQLQPPPFPSPCRPSSLQRYFPVVTRPQSLKSLVLRFNTFLLPCWAYLLSHTTPPPFFYFLFFLPESISFPSSILSPFKGQSYKYCCSLQSTLFPPFTCSLFIYTPFLFFAFFLQGHYRQNKQKPTCRGKHRQGSWKDNHHIVRWWY